MAFEQGEEENTGMQEEPGFVSDDPGICKQCHSTGLIASEKFCPNCGYPQNGDEKERTVYLRTLAWKSKQLNKHLKAVRTSRTVMYVLAVINTFFGIFYFFRDDYSIATLLTGIFAGIIYLLLAKWTYKEPFAAILTGLMTYLIFVANTMLAEPTSLLSGFLFKFFFIASFMYGFKGVKNAKMTQLEINRSVTPVNFESRDDLQ